MMPAVPEFQIELVSLYDFEHTLDRLRQGIQAQGFLLLHEIDTQKIVKAHGVEIAGLKQLLFFHPRYIKAILAANSAGVVEAPLKFVVMEAPPSVMVRYTQPRYLFGRYTALEEIGEMLDSIVRTIARSVTA
jgi:uncharacterized protein (DUF302 family)